jgi:hypothetical protein
MFAIWILDMHDEKGPNISNLGALITRIVPSPSKHGKRSLSRRGVSTMTNSSVTTEQQAMKLMALRVGELIWRQPICKISWRYRVSNTWQAESTTCKTLSEMETNVKVSFLRSGKFTEGAISFGKSQYSIVATRRVDAKRNIDDGSG